MARPASAWMGLLTTVVAVLVLCAAVSPAAGQDVPLVCISGGGVQCQATCPTRCPGKCFLVCPTCTTYCLCEYYPNEFKCVAS